MNTATGQTFAVHAAGDRTQTGSLVYEARKTTTNPKTPVSFLQEVCAKRQITPLYELIKAEGQVHEPTFVVGVTVEDLQTTGTGRSKKYAKHLAAKNLLELLVTSGRHLLWGIRSETTDEALEFIRNLMPEQELIQTPTPQLGDADDRPKSVDVNSVDDASNPVGNLQEMCMKKKWPPAEYNLVREYGLPHDRIFSVKVTLGKYEETGEGKSKKAAKREAAEKMITFLSNLEKQQKDDKTSIIRNREDELSDKFVQVMTDLGHKVKRLMPEDVSTIQAFFDYLKNEPGFNVEQAAAASRDHSTNLHKINFVQILQQVAEKGNFDVIYVDIKDKAFNGYFQCLVQISAKPVAAIYGSGTTPEDAKQMASYHAIEYLKIVTAG